MEMYKKEKINPLGGCLPILVQIPVFIALYWVLLESVELRHAPFILWLDNLTAPDPYYVLPLIMGVSMFIQQKLNPPPPDPIQAKVMMALPFVFTVFFAFFPSGLVLYWTVNQLLSITQQWYITRRSKRPRPPSTQSLIGTSAPTHAGSQPKGTGPATMAERDTIAAVATAPARRSASCASPDRGCRTSPRRCSALPPPRHARLLPAFRRRRRAHRQRHCAVLSRRPTPSPARTCWNSKATAARSSSTSCCSRVSPSAPARPAPVNSANAPFLEGASTSPRPRPSPTSSTAPPSARPPRHPHLTRRPLAARRTLLEALTRERAFVEAALDFPDEEIDFDHADASVHGDHRRPHPTARHAARRRARRGERVRDGLLVVIAGPRTPESPACSTPSPAPIAPSSRPSPAPPATCCVPISSSTAYPCGWSIPPGLRLSRSDRTGRHPPRPRADRPSRPRALDHRRRRVLYRKISPNPSYARRRRGGSCQDRHASNWKTP
jgi:hypothetical protein